MTRAEVEQRLSDLVMRAVSAVRGTSVFVEGPSGIGKTYLCRAVVTAAEAAGAAVYAVAAQESQRRDGFSAIYDLVGSVQAGEDVGEAAFNRLDAVCASRPVVCWLDDAHHADAESLAVFRRLMWAAKDIPLTVVVSARPFPVREPVSQLGRHASIRLVLPELDPAAVEPMILALTGRAPSQRLLEFLAQVSGNPLLIRELLVSLASHDRLDLSEPGWIGLLGGDRKIPTELDDLVRAQLGELDDSVLELVTGIAVFGAAAELNDLAGLLYTDVDTIEPTVDRGVREGVLQRRPRHRVDVVHDIFREVAYQAISSARRTVLHRRAAEVLRAGGARPPLVADHLLRSAVTGAESPSTASTIPAETARVVRDAAEESKHSAPAVAAEFLDDLQTVTGDEERDRLALERAEALFAAGQHMRAEGLIKSYRLRNPRGPIAAAMASVLVRVQLNRAAPDAAIRTIDQLLALPGLPPAARHQLQGIRCWALTLAGQPGRAYRQAMRLADEFERVGDRTAVTGLLSTMACAAWLAGRPGKALDLMARHLDELPSDAVEAQISALIWPPMFELAFHGVDTARQGLEMSRKRATAVGARWLGPYQSFVSALVAKTAGDWDDAIAELTTGLEMAEESGTGWISVAVGTLAYLQAHRGQDRSAGRLLQDFRDSGLPVQFGADDPGLARLAVFESIGSIAEALDEARRLWSSAAEVGALWFVQLAPDVLRVAMAADDQGLADQVAEFGREVDLSELPTAAPVVDLIKGSRSGDADQLVRAAHTAAGFGDVLLAGYGWEEATIAAARAGHADLAHECLERAVEIYQSLQARADQDRALGRARGLGIRRVVRQAGNSPVAHARLTPTEARIADLVHQGLTNPQIATRLWISPRTVQTHVAHIMTKQKVRTRTQIQPADQPD